MGEAAAASVDRLAHPVRPHLLRSDESGHRSKFRSAGAPLGPRGYDAGKKIKGRKRHALVDTDGRGLMLETHSAGIQDRDGGAALLRASRRSFPFVEKVFADSGYAGDTVAEATLIAVEIVRKNPGQIGDLAPVSPDTQAVAGWAAMNSRGERIFSPECGWLSL